MKREPPSSLFALSHEAGAIMQNPLVYKRTCIHAKLVPVPSPPGDLPDPGIEPMSFMSPALAGSFFTTDATWKAPRKHITFWKCQFYTNFLKAQESGYLQIRNLS